MRTYGSLKTLSSESLPAVLGELALVELVDNRTVQAIKLLNDTDAYEMASTMSANVEDTLNFYDTLGTLFRNGTLATYMCPVSSAASHSYAGRTVLSLPKPSETPEAREVHHIVTRYSH